MIKEVKVNKLVALRKINKILDEEIEYLNNHLLDATKGIKLNEERISAWIFQTTHIKQLLNRIKGSVD